ncbi:MAG: type IV pilus assembly protein PilX [Halioglobus sp.]|jgi:type IV pilus assembly protein PilX
MSQYSQRNSERGVALVVSLLFLLVITMISVVAASNSRRALEMAMDKQDSTRSFQAAEAGAYAAFATAGTPEDLFTGVSSSDVFAGMDEEDSPLGNLESGTDSVTTDVIQTSAATACPRRAAGSSVSLFDCDYYRIESQHAVARRAQSQVNVGVVKTIIGKSVR